MHDSDSDIAEVGVALAAARNQLEMLFVRGLATTTASDLKGLSQQAQDWERLGAVHVAARMNRLINAINGNSGNTPHMLMTTYTSLAVLERVLSGNVAAATFQNWPADEPADDTDIEPAPTPVSKRKVAAVTAKSKKAKGSETPATPARIVTHREASPSTTAAKPAVLAPSADLAAGLQIADDLARTVEQLLLTGLVSATSATRDKLDATFKEASRSKLLRIGASLRYVNEEIGRYLADDGTFTARRFGLFLHRSWLLARGFAHAMRGGDAVTAQRLALGTGSAPRIVRHVELVTLGVLKRVVSTACTFDFKLRVVSAMDQQGQSSSDLLGRTVTWSFVFARKTAAVSAETYLHLPQPQKYVPTLLLEKHKIHVHNASIATDDRGNLRLTLAPTSKVVAGDEVTDWSALYQWNVAAIEQRVTSHSVTPLDLAVEAQEEVVLSHWTAKLDSERSTSERMLFTILQSDSAPSFDGVVSTGADGVELKAALCKAASSRAAPCMPLYGLAYAENGRMLLLPLSYLTAQGPQHLMWSSDNIDVSSLMNTLTIG
jgi:hypothetical protein